MVDDLSRFHGLTRSQLMARIRSRGNKKTEVALARLLREHHVTGWRRHYPLAGTPDFVFVRDKIAIFVDGCFWHGCKKHFKLPATRTSFWRSKIEKNQLRDRQVKKRLKAEGWRVLRIWEHELQKRNELALLKKIHHLLS
jgi:DNA mismatch endonuclease (patch repair protein)